MTDSSNGQYWTTEDVARVCAVSIVTVKRWVKSGLPCRRINKTTLRYIPAEVRQWVDDQHRLTVEMGAMVAATPDSA